MKRQPNLHNIRTMLHNYGSLHDIQIKILADRLIVYSPGQLPFDMSMEMLMTENHPSRPRNKLIAQAFYDIHLIEHYGSGMKRIKQECDQNGNDYPIMQNEMGTFSTTYFPRKADDTINAINDTTKHGVDTTKHDSNPINQGGEPVNHNGETVNEEINGRHEEINGQHEPINEPVNEPVKLVLAVIADNPNLSKEKIAEKIGMSRATVTRALAKLVEIGAIQRFGSDKSGHWEIVENGE